MVYQCTQANNTNSSSTCVYVQINSILIFDLYMFPCIFHFTFFPLWPLYLFKSGLASIHLKKGSFSCPYFPQVPTFTYYPFHPQACIVCTILNTILNLNRINKVLHGSFIHCQIWHEVLKAGYNEPGSADHSWALKEMIQGDVIRVVDKGQ